MAPNGGSEEPGTSEEPDANKLNDGTASTKKARRKAPWWDASATREKIHKIRMKAEEYRLDRVVQHLEIQEHKMRIFVMQKDLEQNLMPMVSIQMGIMDRCGRALEKLGQSLDEFRSIRLEMQEIFAENSKICEEAAQEANSQPPYPSMSVGPQELRDLGLDDLSKFVQQKVIETVVEDEETRKGLLEELTKSPPTEKTASDADPTALPPTRKWMNPKQKERQQHKRLLSTEIKRYRKPERTSLRTEKKKKKLAKLKSTSKHRRQRFVAETVIWKLHKTLSEEKFRFTYQLTAATKSRLMYKIVTRNWTGVVPEHLHDDFDTMLESLGSLDLSREHRSETSSNYPSDEDLYFTADESSGDEVEWFDSS